MKYRPDSLGILTWAREPGREPCMVGSLTGAVSSKKVTEERKGALSAVGNRAECAMAKSALDCETDGSSRRGKRVIVIRRRFVEGPSLNG